MNNTKYSSRGDDNDSSRAFHQTLINNSSTNGTASSSEIINSYLITRYALPNRLKPIIKEKDPAIEFNRKRLDTWHEEGLLSRKPSSVLRTEAFAASITRDKYKGKKWVGGINSSSGDIAMNTTKVTSKH